jgi:hypothetical protein
VTVDLEKKDTGQEAPRDVEVAEAPTPAPEPLSMEQPEQLDLEAVVPPTEEDLIERAHAELVREVMKALTQQPRGLPTTLWGKDMAVLAREIVDGPRKSAPDGTMLVEVDGKWYQADHNKPGTFLVEWEEDEAEPVDAATGRERRLQQLEDRLIEGKISEETYERLRKKYKGS